ncbi:MAG: hypothetical protein Q4G16_09195, partial [Cruoricaptor ignavus]|nr:hypothetical protein [Cruoricaptor ignavus]
MNKTIKIYAVIFAIVLAILALLEINRNEVVDWRKNYDTAKKTPFGLYVFDKEANSIFGNHLIKINESPYDYYNEKTEKKPHNILIIEQNIDGESWNKIFSHISKGSDAMVVSEYFSPKLIDTLGIWASNISYEDNQIFKLTDKKFSKDTLIVDKLPSRRGFSEISANTEILGVATDKETKQQPNFIKVKYGKGNVYLHADPLFLTNYYLLKKGNKTYFQDVFSYLPNRETLWFTEETSASAPSSSILRVVLANPPLKYAWWLFLAGLLLFTFFNAKRKQRIVPIVEP